MQTLIVRLREGENTWDVGRQGIGSADARRPLGREFEMPDAPFDRMANRRPLREFVDRCFPHQGCSCEVGVAGGTTAVALDFVEVAPVGREMIWHQPLLHLRVERTSYL